MNAIDTASDRLPPLARPLAWVASLGLVFLPLLALKLGDAGAWRAEDLPFALIFAAAMIVAFELAVRAPARWTFQLGAAIGLGALALLTLGNLAVGFAGSEDNGLNQIVFIVPAVAIIGSAVARLRASGLAVTMLLTAIAQLGISLVFLVSGWFTGPLTFAFVALFLAAAWLFRRAARAG